MIRIMRTRVMHVVALLAVIGCAVGGQHARAEVIAIQNWSGAVEYVTHSGVTLGYDFTVGAAPIIVTKLGFFDYGADGLSESHEVGIWQLNNTTALATATITTTSPLEGPMIDTDKGQFRFEELASTVRLSANTTYRIGAYYSSSHTDRIVQSQSGQTPSKTIAEGITYGPPRYRYYGSGLVRPDNEGARTLGYIGPNFQFVPRDNYYRMETDGGIAVSPGQNASSVDDTSLFAYHGAALPAGSPPTYSSDVPAPLVVRDGIAAPNLASLSFSGTGDYVDLGNEPFLTTLPEDDFTIEFFLKTPARDSRSILVGTYDGVSSGTLNLEIGGLANGTARHGRLRAYLHGTNQLGDMWGTTNISDDEWHHVALVRSGTGTGSDLIQLYVDYQLDNSLTRNVGAYTIAADFFRLGLDSGASNRLFYYQGLLDEFRISRAALDVSEFLRAGREWTGDGANNLWTTAANWAGATAPVAGNALFFGGTTQLATVNDFAPGISFAGITFNSDAGAFVLSGNRVTLDGNLTNNSASVQTVQFDMILDSTRTVSGSVTLQGALSGNGGLTKSGSGELVLSGSSPNTYNGLTTVSGGTLRLGKTASAIAVPGDLVISGGGVTFNTDNQIANGAAVVVSGGGTFNGTGFNEGWRAQNETIGSLIVTGGSFNTGGGGTGWNVTGAASFTGGAGDNNTRFLGHSQSTTRFGSLSLTNMTGTAGDVPTRANTFTVYGAVAPKQSSIFVGSGGLTLNNSVLNLRRGSATNSPGSRLVLDGDVTTTGTLPSAISEDIAGGTFGNIAVELSSTPGDHTRTFNIGGGGADLTIGVPVTNGAATTAGITKIGAGTLTLNAVNTYTGLTTVLGGTLAVTGSLAKNTSADVLVASAGTAFDGTEPAIVRSVAGEASFVGLGSQIIGDRLFETRTELLAGTNQGVDPLPVGMAWRMFADGEPQSTAPYLHAVSDVVQLTGMAETSPFVLQMTYDASLVTPATEGGLHLAWLDGAQWVNAVAGNAVTGDDAVARYWGSWGDFTGVYGSDLNALLGSWGVDTGSASVWAVLNHNSEFGVLVPEPGTWLMLLAAAAAGLLLRRRGKR